MPRGQQSIQAFGRVSKIHTETTTSKKRKAALEPIETSIETTDVKGSRKKRCLVSASSTPTETPTKAISLRFARLELTRRSPTPTPSGRRRTRVAAPADTFEDTPPTSPCPSHNAGGQLPEELESLKALNAALLGALAIHYAHNGTASPLDVRRLTPSVTKMWGKRRVTLVDVKRCLGLLPGILCPFQLFDYGQGRICIELQSQGRKAKMGTHFDQEQLVQDFSQAIEESWAKWWPGSVEDDHDISVFLNQLPMANVRLSPTAAKTAQALTLAKGQKRLRDVLDGRENEHSTKREFSSKRRKAGVLAESENVPQQEASIQPVPAPTPKESSLQPSAAPVARGQSLLDRIRAKQTLASTLPAGPSKDQLARVAALHRVEEVMSILDLLVAARGQGPRASFPTQSLIQNIQSSLRSPMAKDEVEKCLEVMEREVALGYVKVLKMGAMNGVVVDMSQKPRKEILKERLRAGGA